MLTSMDKLCCRTVNLVVNAMQIDGQVQDFSFFFSPLPATKLVRFFAQVCNHVGWEVPVKELHSTRMSQAARQRASQFRRFIIQSSSAVLFTSDVSARGVDYPDMTHVIQIIK
mmetsp:Transcript_12582/g.22862  ORF Transcript_12582/g.22862 Transcript_12582/m.22862 type:complete len:113 (-) Transcript_12582:647-985(-)